ncbi:MAG: S9 family peptidase [Alphaproteobacteria bacterium]|nr:S9 family peptidase [Alphaproteobacteria bacterium]
MPASIATWLELDSAMSPAVAADARTLWYLATPSGAPQIWRLDLDSDAPPVQVTSHEDRVMMIRTAPKGPAVAYGIDAGGDERMQLRLLPGGGVAARPLTDAPDVIHGWGGFSPDGAQLAFTANDRDPASTDLLVMDVATGARRRVWATGGPYELAGWHPDGKRLLALSVPRDLESLPVLVDVASGAHEWLTPRAKRRYLAPRWRKDGAGFWCLSDRDGEHLALCWFELATRRLEALATPPHDVERLAVSPDQRTIAFVVNEEGWSRLRFLDVGSGALVDAPALPDGTIGDMSWAGTARLVLALSTPTAPSALWLVERDRHRARELPALPRHSAPPAPAQAPVLFEFPTADGRVPAWFYRPEGIAPDGGFPALIWVHGGPAMQARPEFRADIQWCLTRGIAVMVPNIRGSTGYGRAYTEADDHALRPAAIADVEAARRGLIARGDIDPARIAIMGQSYGGWMVLAATTRYPQGWACAIDFYGIASWTTFFEQTGIWRRSHRAAEYGDPVLDRELLEELSPLKDADRIATPMLVAQGLRDPRVAPLESEQIVAALRRRNHPVEYVTIPDEGHGFVKRRNRMTVYAAVARFLEASLALKPPPA